MELFESENLNCCLPTDYRPVKTPFFEPERIILSKGSMETQFRRRFVESIISLYPIAKIAQEASPETRVALCLEEQHIWKNLGLANNLGRCNCVL